MGANSRTERWDVFISHASEDKEAVALPLAEELRQAGLTVWLDAHELTLGDSLRTRIDEGLSNSCFGVVILSEAFFSKDWPQRELSALVATESKSRKLILPVLHGIDHRRLAHYSPILADRISVTTERGIQHIAMEIARAIHQSREQPDENAPSPSPAPYHSLFQPGSLEGASLGAYRLCNHLGSGGSGVVFLASHKDLGDQLAIKIFYPLAAEYARFDGLFERGFLALSRLKHPHIVSTKDFGRADLHGLSVSYMVMDYIVGMRLDRWSLTLEGNPDAFGMRLRVTRQLAEAMLAAHETTYVDALGFEVRGVLHGDLKPSNAIIRPEGTPVLLDFLLVDVQRLMDPRIVSLKRAIEPVTAAFGTPGFMAPEQAAHGIVTASTDIYGLGITLCYLFFPSHPSPQVALKQDNDLPRPVRKLLNEMTENEPRLRPQSMRDVVARLRIRSGPKWLEKLIAR